MASDGEYVELGTCLEMVIDHRGKTPKKLGADWVERGVPTISAKNVNGGRLVAEDAIRYVSHEVYKRWMKDDVKRGDCFLVSEGATLGECMLWDEDYPVVLGQRIFCLRANPTVLYPRYLYSYMTSANFQSEIIARATGTSVDGLRQTEVLKMKIKLLPMEHQRQIGDTLYFLNTKIELNRRMNETLEGLARAIFQSWFVDFDPVRAQRDGLPPPALSPATAALFPDSFQESPLGPVPRGWEVCSLADKIELLGGGTPKTSEPAYWDGDIPWYSVRDAPSEADVWVMHTEKHITKDGVTNSAAQILREGTTIISARGTVGKLALIGTPMAMNQSCYGVRGISGYGDFFTYFALRQATADLQQRTHGTVFDTITRQTFETLDCTFPPANLTAAFDRTVAPLLAQIRANLYQSRTLATLRDTLLPKLLSGELRVAGLEFQLAAAS